MHDIILQERSIKVYGTLYKDEMKFNAHNYYKLPANPSLQVHTYELP